MERYTNGIKYIRDKVTNISLKEIVTDSTMRERKQKQNKTKSKTRPSKGQNWPHLRIS